LENEFETPILMALRDLLLGLADHKLSSDCSTNFQFLLVENCQSFKDYFGGYQDSSETISKLFGAIKIECHDFKLILGGQLLISVTIHDSASCGYQQDNFESCDKFLIDSTQFTNQMSK
jgi:hypothetical protein